MADDSLTYCDSEEEIFLGKVTDQEVARSALFGQDYCSPAVKCSTPRQKAANYSSHAHGLLPDVLRSAHKRSCINPVLTSANDKKNEDSDQSYFLFHNDLANDSDEVIMVDSIDLNDSVQIISDDESFLKNEEIVGFQANSSTDSTTRLETHIPSIELESKITDGAVELENDASLSNTDEKDKLIVSEGGKLDNDSLYDCKSNSENLEIISNRSSSIEELKVNIITVEISEHKENTSFSSQVSDYQNTANTIEHGDISSVVTSKELTIKNTSGQSNQFASDACLPNLGFVSKSNTDSKEPVNNSLPNQQCTVTENLKKTNENESSDDGLQSKSTLDFIDHDNSSFFSNQEFVESTTKRTSNFDNNTHLPEFKSKASSEIFELEKVNPVSIEALIQASIRLENEFSDRASQENKAFDQPCNKSGLSDFEYSSLNSISDSILNISHGSSLPSPLHAPYSKAPIPNVIYEDISCDGEQVLNTTNETLSNSVDDLQMSVDETDYQLRQFVDNFGTSLNVSHPSFYKSCASGSDVSSYYTAYNPKNENVTQQSHQLSSSFRNYRDHLEIDEENKGETSFEMVAKNRQNSFIAPVSLNDPTSKKVEQVKSKIPSKLPVYQISASLLKTPKLNVKPGVIKSNSYKWAKTLSKPEDIVGSRLRKQESSKVIDLPPKKISETKVMCKSQTKTNTTPHVQLEDRLLNKVKTPAEHKTPPRSIKVPQLRLVKSESKTPKILKPTLKFMSNEKKGEIKNPTSSLPDKNLYKNVMSPIRAYITGSPVVLQKIAQDLNTPGHEDTRLTGSANKNTVSRIPLKKQTPMKTSKVVQKLDYENIQGQENVDPNFTRDTLGPKSLQVSSAVFLKEPVEPRRYFPKMGESMHKLLDTPRPKVIVHQGRVKESPKVKGVLIPNALNTIPAQCDGRISVRVVKSPEKTNCIK